MKFQFWWYFNMYIICTNKSHLRKFSGPSWNHPPMRQYQHECLIYTCLLPAFATFSSVQTQQVATIPSIHTQRGWHCWSSFFLREEKIEFGTKLISTCHLLVDSSQLNLIDEREFCFAAEIPAFSFLAKHEHILSPDFYARYQRLDDSLPFSRTIQ